MKKLELNRGVVSRLFLGIGTGFKCEKKIKINDENCSLFFDKKLEYLKKKKNYFIRFDFLVNFVSWIFNRFGLMNSVAFG